MRALFVCFALLIMCASLQAATWKTDPQSVNLTRPNPDYTWYYTLYKISDGSTISSGTTFQNMVIDPTVNQNAQQPIKARGTIPSFTFSQQFRLRCYAWKSASEIIEYGWWMSYLSDDGDTTNDGNKEQVKNSDGSFSNGTSGNSAGTGPTQNPEGAGQHSLTYSISNPGTKPEQYQVNQYDGEGNLTSSKTITAAAGETRTITTTSSDPFSIKISKLVGDPDGGMTFQPVYSGNSKPITSPGTTPNGTTVASSSNQTTNGVPTEYRPGTTNGDTEARHLELRKEMQQVGANVKNGADRVTNAVLEGNQSTSDGLAGVKAAIEAQGPNGSGGTGGGGEGEEVDLSTVEELLRVQDQGAVSQPADAVAAVNGLGDALALIHSDISDIASKISPFTGSGSLIFSLSVYGQEITVDLEQYGGILDACRLACMVYFAYIFVWSGVGIVRGFFVDEGR